MVKFTLSEVTAISAAKVAENGDTQQECLLDIRIDGFVIKNKKVQDFVTFTVPNSVFANSQQPTVAGWLYIKEQLAPQWVNDNYQAE